MNLLNLRKSRWGWACHGISGFAFSKACKSASQWRFALSLMRNAQENSLAMDGFACSAAARHLKCTLLEGMGEGQL